jgi:hypothetical protein
MGNRRAAPLVTIATPGFAAFGIRDPKLEAA